MRLFWDIVLLHQQRWVELALDGRSSRVYRKFTNLRLPRLTQLRIEGSFDTIPSTWHMPNLTLVDCGDCGDVLAKPLMASVTSYLTTVRSPVEDNPMDFIQFLEPLVQSPGLTHITLRVWEYKFENSAAGPSFTLPCLTSLELEVGPIACDASLLDWLPGMPNLREFKLGYMEGWPPEAYDNFRTFAQRMRASLRTYPRLRHFTVSYHRTAQDNGNPDLLIDFLDELLLKMPMLEVFTLKASLLKPVAYDCIWPTSTPNLILKLPRLHTIRFMGCKQVHVAYLAGLIKLLRKTPGWAAFKALDVYEEDPEFGSDAKSIIERARNRSELGELMERNAFLRVYRR